MAIEDLRQSPMMSHMLDEGEDVGHYGRLIFVMIGRQFAATTSSSSY